MPQFTTLKQYFKATFRYSNDQNNKPERTIGKKVMKRTIEQLQVRKSKKRYGQAKTAFLQSMAGYSLFCYIL